MTNRRRAAGVGMIVAALVLGLAAWVMWQNATDDAESDALAARYEQAILLDQGRSDLAATVDADPDPNRSPAVAMAVVGGLLFLGGVILIATAPPLEG